jgi:hypothetical protein
VYADDKQTLSFRNNETAGFRAVVVGENDSSVRWSTVPDSCAYGRIDDKGKFTASFADDSVNPGRLKVRAESIANPRLVDLVDIQVTR